MNHMNVNLDWMEVYVIQNKNWIRMNFGVKRMGFCKNDYTCYSICDCECNKACKIGEYLDIKNYSCKKRIFIK